MWNEQLGAAGKGQGRQDAVLRWVQGRDFEEIVDLSSVNASGPIQSESLQKYSNTQDPLLSLSNALYLNTLHSLNLYPEYISWLEDAKDHAREQGLVLQGLLDDGTIDVQNTEELT